MTNANAEEPVRAFFAETDSAWARHDAKALAAQFAEDATFIFPHGQVKKGRDDIEAAFSADMAARFLIAFEKSPRWRYRA